MKAGECACAWCACRWSGLSSALESVDFDISAASLRLDSCWPPDRRRAQLDGFAREDADFLLQAPCLGRGSYANCRFCRSMAVDLLGHAPKELAAGGLADLGHSQVLRQIPYAPFPGGCYVHGTPSTPNTRNTQNTQNTRNTRNTPNTRNTRNSDSRAHRRRLIR